MDLDGLKDQAMAAKDALAEKASEVKDAVTSEEGTDNILNSVADAASKLTGGKLDGQIDAARDFLDGKLGSE